MLYRCDPLGIQQNCLQNLPAASIVANMVRLCYAVVCVTSYPLCLAPLADMSEKALCACEGAGSTLEASRSGSAAVHQEPEKQERGLRKESGGGGAGGPTRGGGSSCDGMEWNRFVVPMRLLVMRLALVLAALGRAGHRTRTPPPEKTRTLPGSGLLAGLWPCARGC